MYSKSHKNALSFISIIHIGIKNVNNINKHSAMNITNDSRATCNLSVNTMSNTNHIIAC